jgi:hypothetical protein
VMKIGSLAGAARSFPARLNRRGSRTKGGRTTWPAGPDRCSLAGEPRMRERGTWSTDDNRWAGGNRAHHVAYVNRVGPLGWPHHWSATPLQAKSSSVG